MWGKIRNGVLAAAGAALGREGKQTRRTASIMIIDKQLTRETTRTRLI